MKRSFAALCGLAFASLLAGCGNASDNLAFKVPNGYQSKVSVLGMVQIWTQGGSADQSMIMLTKLPVKKDIASKDAAPLDLTSTAGLKSDKTTVESMQQISICGNQPARLMKMRVQESKPTATASPTGKTASAASPAAKEMQMEMLMTNVGNNSYVAMYMYPQTDKPDAAAEAALKTVCAKAS